MALDMAGPVWEAQEKMRRAAWSATKQRTAALVYRSTINDVPDYRADPVQSARAMWDYHKQKWPPELDRRIVYAGIVNEPATFLSRGEGYEHALRKVMINPSSQLAELDNSEWLAAHALELCRLARAAGVRFSVLGWSPGSPEPFQWRGPQMTALLDLLRAHPDELAIDCHEYSLRADAMPESALIGRFRNIPAPWPSILISEFGYTLREAPPASIGVGQILSNYGRIYAYPQVRGLAIWTLGKEGESWGNLGQVINGYLEPLTRGILATDFTPLTPPTPPTEGAMLIDLSKWNGTLDAAKAKQNGVLGVILRASYGLTRDEMVTEYAARLKAAGIPVIGCYHYYHPWQPMQPQLETFVAAARAVGARRGYLDLEDMRFTQVAALEQMDDDAPPDVLRAANAAAMRNLGINPDATSADDLYEPGLEAVAMSAAQPQLVEAARQFMAGLSTALPLPAGKRHGIYSNYSYIGAILGNAAFMAQYDLWLAAWTIAAAPVVPAPWATWTLWQYSNSGNGPGFGLQSARVDLNRFNGTAAGYAEWLKIENAPVDVAAAIRTAAAKQPGAGWHPTHALPMRILADGFYPISGEFNVPVGSMTYRALRAYDKTGVQFVYFAPVDQWHKTERIAL